MAIVCGIDLSDASPGVIAAGFAIARARGDRDLVVVHIIDEGSATEQAVSAARHRLADLTGGAPSGLSVRCEVLAGPPAETMVSFAATETCDLLIVAAHSSGPSSHGPSRLRLGSTTDVVVAHSHVPVLVLRDPKPWVEFAAGTRPLRTLVAMDDSAVCELGVQWVHGLRQRGRLEVIVGAIYYPDDATDHYGLDYKSFVDRDPEVEKMMARDLIRRFGGSPDGVSARPRRGLGRLGDHVVELANEERADVIVIGTSQKTGLGRLGSVSSIVVTDAPQSVVCVPPDARIATIVVPVLRSALVATDLSQFSNRAIPYAFAVCEPDAEIHLVHIVDDDDADVGEVERALYALAPAKTRQKVTAHVVRGDDAAKTVAQTAARLGVDIICMCSHGRSGLTRALVGSVADRLLRATRLPVLVLRPS